jgi:signal transduction histidine kinase/DNA-binding response OmpR family regulator
MTFDANAFEAMNHASREMHIACTSSGRVVYADSRAHRLLGLAAGTSLVELCAPGCDAKLEEMLERVSHGRVDDWEVPFIVDDKPVTMSLCAARHGDHVLIVGALIPEPFVRSMTQYGAMMADLAESHRGILALHAELRDTEQHSRQDADIKARLVANLSHELRTPLHSILGLTQLLSSHTDGALGAEQEKQVGFIRSSAEELLSLVDDVLDLGSIASGHARLHVDAFGLGDFVSSMRGSLKPLVPESSPVELVIEDAPDIRVETDQTKLAQIVRNLVSNAIKFTDEGEVRVRCEIHGERLRITVRDQGIGIAPADQEKIFEEYGQVESSLQRRVKGTGLGLPLARRLAGTLGGTLTLVSEPGAGSTFTVDVPIKHDEARAMDELVERNREKAPGATSILVVEDDRKTLFLYEKYLVMAGYHVMAARSVEEAEAIMARSRPAAIVLDVMLEGDSSWGFLARVKSAPETRDIPVLVVTVTNRADKARALGADEFWLKPVDQDRLLRKLGEIAASPSTVQVLVIDDDPTARYIIGKHLEGTPYRLLEAGDGHAGVELARTHQPQVILLDFLLEGSTAFDVLDELKADPATRGIPVIVVTSHILDAVDQARLLEEAEAVISKQNLSRELAINRIRDALRKLERSKERPR